MKPLLLHPSDVWPVGVISGGVLLGLLPFFVPLSAAAVAVLLVVSLLARSVAPVHQHCHAHRPVFRPKILNLLYDFLLMLAAGNTTAVWELQHVRGHHRLLLERGADPARTTRFGGSGALRRVVFTVAGDALSLFDAHRIARLQRDPTRWHTRLWAQQAIHAAALAALAVWDLQLAMVMFVVPNVVLRWTVFWFSFSQHDGAPGNDVYDSSNTHFGWTNAVFLNVGHHTAHHEKPTLHWSLLPRRTSAILGRIPEQCLK